MTDTNRRTGRTTRMLLRAILAASEKPNQNVVVVGHNHAYARELARQAWDIVCAATRGFVADRTEWSEVRLKNGSQLVFVATCPEDYGDESWRAGRPDLQVFEDHYVTEVMPHARTALREDVVRRRAKELGVEHLLRSPEEIARVRSAVKRVVDRTYVGCFSCGNVTPDKDGYDLLQDYWETLR